MYDSTILLVHDLLLMGKDLITYVGNQRMWKWRK